MSEHVVKILEAEFITHNVKRFVLEKPPGYTYTSGQATDISVNQPEWKNELRPFTFTSLVEWDYLEFMIKIYPERNSVTNQLGKTNAGAELILHDVFGAIHYKGPGVFIAGGAGITPFMSIFRNLEKQKQLAGNKLLYSNRTSDDVIMEKELQKMLDKDFIKVFTREHVIGFLGNRIDRDFLVNTIGDFSGHFYLCGPDGFVNDIKALLVELGADAEALIFEE